MQTQFTSEFEQEKDYLTFRLTVGDDQKRRGFCFRFKDSVDWIKIEYGGIAAIDS
jgi:hypothetical protein